MLFVLQGMSVDVELIDTSATVLVVTETSAVLEHPFVVPITVYMVDVVGDTLIELVVSPVFQM